MEYRPQIKEMRDRMGMSQRDLAARLGLSPGAVALWELGRTNPTMENLLALADVLDCTLDELFGREPPERTSA